jgi:hypothetical protein
MERSIGQTQRMLRESNTVSSFDFINGYLVFFISTCNHFAFSFKNMIFNLNGIREMEDYKFSSVYVDTW